jgi:hypothetical protein
MLPIVDQWSSSLHWKLSTFFPFLFPLEKNIRTGVQWGFFFYSMARRQLNVTLMKLSIKSISW